MNLVCSFYGKAAAPFLIIDNPPHIRVSSQAASSNTVGIAMDQKAHNGVERPYVTGDFACFIISNVLLALYLSTIVVCLGEFRKEMVSQAVV